MEWMGGGSVNYHAQVGRAESRRRAWAQWAHGDELAKARRRRMSPSRVGARGSGWRLLMSSWADMCTMNLTLTLALGREAEDNEGNGVELRAESQREMCPVGGPHSQATAVNWRRSLEWAAIKRAAERCEAR